MSDLDASNMITNLKISANVLPMLLISDTLATNCQCFPHIASIIRSDLVDLDQIHYLSGSVFRGQLLIDARFRLFETTKL